MKRIASILIFFAAYLSVTVSAIAQDNPNTHYTKPTIQEGVIDANSFNNSDRLNNTEFASSESASSGSIYTDIVGMTKIEYHGPVIYRNGKIDMVRFPGGYATVNGSAVTFHYYTQDYLGCNRAVINGSTGAIEQTIAYYPYGSVIADLGSGTTGQSFKFGSKELVTDNGLNEYDFEARQYYPAVPHFTGIDPMCEKFYWLSPYLYCANNPVNAVDPDGKDIWCINTTGHLVSSLTFETFDMMMVFDKSNKIKNIWKGKYGTISEQFSNNDPSAPSNLMGFEINGDVTGTEIFELFANNTSVEWSHLKTGDNTGLNTNFVSTTHFPNKDASAFILITKRLNKIPIREYIHNHPSNTSYPSGMKSNDKSGDVFFARWLDKINPISATYKIYTSADRMYTFYNSQSKKCDFFKSLQEIYVYP